MILIKKIQEIGMQPWLDLDSKKKLLMVNNIGIIGTLTNLFTLVFTLLFEVSTLMIWFHVLSGFLMLIPLVMNHFKKYDWAHISFITIGLFLIFSFNLIVTPNIGFAQYFLISVSLPFIFLKGNRPLQISLSISPLIMFGYLQWHWKHFNPLINIQEENWHNFIILNDFVLIALAIIVFSLFSAENDKHIDELTQKSTKLEHQIQGLERFAYSVSHDLKEPINNISSLIDIIKSDLDEKTLLDQKLNFEMISGLTKRTSGLISSILEYSRSQQQKFQIETIVLADLYMDVLKFNIPYDHIKYEYDHPNFTIQGSQAQLKQVITNLVTNAVKYMDKENGLIKITTEKINNSYFKVSVSDNGPGIDQKYHTKIFEPFETANFVQRKDSTGIGLGIVANLVSANQGEYGVTSAPGEGSTFWFTWPNNLKDT